VNAAYALRDARLTPSRLDKIGKHLAAGEETPDDLELLNAFQAHVVRATADVFPRISELAGCLGSDLTQRPRKQRQSIQRKLKREKTRLHTMQDLAGCRIITNSALLSGMILNEVQARYVGDVCVLNSVKTGYSAIHYIIRRHDLCYEVQIRTDIQQAWADLSESFDEKYPGVKYGDGPLYVTAALRDLAKEMFGFEMSRDQRVLEAAAADAEIDPRRIPEVRLARRRIDVRLAELMGGL
jgi:hypothetical protein